MQTRRKREESKRSTYEDPSSSKRTCSSLPPTGFFTFTKELTASYVSGRLRLPTAFARSHLSNVFVDKAEITLIDENEKEFVVTYHPCDSTPEFGKGWKNFVDAHGFSENDFLEFILIDKPKGRFKVIPSAPFDVDAALTKESDTWEESDMPDESNYTSEESTDQQGAEFKNKIRDLFSKADMNVGEAVLEKYYNHCLSKKEILHDRMQAMQPDYFNLNLVVAIITQLVRIVDELKAVNIISREKLRNWRAILQSYEPLGMKVGFVLKKVNDLIGLSSDIEETPYKDELRKLEIKHVELKEACVKVDKDIAELKSKAETHKNKVQEIINSPW